MDVLFKWHWSLANKNVLHVVGRSEDIDIPNRIQNCQKSHATILSALDTLFTDNDKLSSFGVESNPTLNPE